MDIVQDSNVFVSALLRGRGSSAVVLRRCLAGDDVPVLGQALLAEHEDLLERPELWADAVTTAEERELIFNQLCAAARWQRVFFLWRPNLPDPKDDHVLELALAGGVEHLVTKNTRHFKRGDLKFSRPRIVTPAEHLEVVT